MSAADVRERVEAAGEPDEAAVARLAKLSPIKYDKVREGEAKACSERVKLTGFRSR